jgi:hypothetical protein
MTINVIVHVVRNADVYVQAAAIAAADNIMIPMDRPAPRYVLTVRLIALIFTVKI